MTTEDTAETADDTDEETGDRDPAWYREQLKEVKGQRDTALAKLERLAFAELGITDTESGMGKALKLTYEGDIDPEDTAALKEAAAEFGWKEAEDADTQPETPTTAQPEVSDAEGRIRQLEGASTPAEPNALRDEGEAALEAGKPDEAIAAFVAEQMRDGTIDLGGPD